MSHFIYNIVELTMASRPTPYSIAVLTLIALHCQENSPLYENVDPSDLHVDAFLLETLQSPRGATPLSLHDRPLAGWFRKMRVSLGHEVTQTFYSWLQVAAISIDSLEDLMLTCRRALIDHLDPQSRCGRYLSAVCLGYDQLSFESVAMLWKDFRNEVESVDLDDDNEEEKDVEDSAANTSGMSLASSSSNASATANSLQEWTLSGTQLSQALRRELQRGDTPYSKETLDALQLILESNPELPMAHFLHFVSSMHAGDREAAVDALHQYLDYSFDDSGSILQY